MRKGIMALLVLGLLLSGCSGKPFTREEAAPPEEAVYGMSTSQVESAPRPLPDEEILAAYERAVEVYGWFVTDPLPDNGELVDMDGTLYRKVDSEGMAELDDLRAYLRSVFSRELTEQLLESGGEVHYRDIGGALYVTGEGRSRDEGKGEASIQIQQAGDGAYSVNVTVDLLDSSGAAAGLECWSFLYCFDKDRWVFSDFQLIY